MMRAFKGQISISGSTKARAGSTVLTVMNRQSRITTLPSPGHKR